MASLLSSVAHAEMSVVQKIKMINVEKLARNDVKLKILRDV